jgi:RNA polymerase sigma factor (TIGR02999 family)
MPSSATRLLAELRGGRSLAAEELFPLVLAELRQCADAFARRLRPGHTLQATALVNEAYLRLVKQDEAGWEDRTHFLAVASLAMRHVLVDHARRRNRAKRGDGRGGVPFDPELLAEYETSGAVDVEALHGALARLETVRPMAARIVDMRFFAAMTVEEIAHVLRASASTVEREWRYARAWLKDALANSPP